MSRYYKYYFKWVIYESYIGGLVVPEIQKYDLSSFIPDGKPILKKYEQKEYSIQKYQGMHSEQYTIMEIENGVENGVAQLFENGILQMSWNMKNGVRDGKLTIYEDGIVVRMMDWEELLNLLPNKSQYYNNNVIREIVNVKNRKRLLIETLFTSGIVIYKGEFDPITWKKEGFGTVYDCEDGVEKHCGYFHNDELIHICQVFLKKKDGQNDNESSRIMIEYGGDKHQDNVLNVLNRQPIYKGGYIYHESSGRFIRYGHGREINLDTGICDRVGEWNEKGEMIEETVHTLHGGWYDEGECEHSIRTSKVERTLRDNEQVTICPAYQYQLIRKTNECIIAAKQMNDRIPGVTQMAVVFDDFTSMEYIKIDSHCCRYVSEFIIQNMPVLDTIEIEKKCFRTDEIESTSGLFYIGNCPQLRQLTVRNNSFCFFKSFKLSNLNSLQTIDIGEGCFQNVREFVLDGFPSLKSVMIDKRCFTISNKRREDGICCITNCPSLLHVGIGSGVFQDFTQFTMTNVPLLQSIDFGTNCFYRANFMLKSKSVIFSTRIVDVVVD